MAQVSKEFYSVSEVATILSLSKSQVYKKIHTGAIPSILIVDNVRIPVDWIEGIIAQGGAA